MYPWSSKIYNNTVLENAIDDGGLLNGFPFG